MSILRVEIIFDVANVIACCYIIFVTAFALRREDSGPKVMFAFATVIAIFCVTNLAIAVYLRDQIFQDPRLSATKECLIYLPLRVRVVLAVFYFVVLIGYGKTASWISLILLIGYFLLMIAEAVIQNVEKVRSKRREEDISEHEDYEMGSEQEIALNHEN